MPRFTAITTCKGRLAHIRRTLPALAAQADCEVVLVDYDCPDGVGDWAASAHPEVQVVRIADRPLFNLSQARNLGAAAATGEWLIFLDADVLTAPALTGEIAARLQPRAYFCPAPRPAELWGSLVVARADFEAVGGYDEAFEGWGEEDVDMRVRLGMAGLAAVDFPGALLTSLSHGDADRTRFHAIGDRRINGGLNSLYRRIKTDLFRLGVWLDLDLRRQLYAEVRAAFTAEGGARTLSVNFRQSDHAGRPVAASLNYVLAEAGPNSD